MNGINMKTEKYRIYSVINVQENIKGYIAYMEYFLFIGK